MLQGCTKKIMCIDLYKTYFKKTEVKDERLRRRIDS